MLEGTQFAFLLVKDFLSLRRTDRLQLQAGLVDVQHSEAEKGVPHLECPVDMSKGQWMHSESETYGKA